MEYILGDGKLQNVHNKKWKAGKLDVEEVRRLGYNRNKQLSDIANEIKTELVLSNVKYNEAKLLKKSLSTDKIVERLGGGDKTEGSCSSLAFAYIGNKNGIDVLDFRGGKSQEKFSTPGIIRKMLNLPNVRSTIVSVDRELKGTIEVLEGLELNKE